MLSGIPCYEGAGDTRSVTIWRWIASCALMKYCTCPSIHPSAKTDPRGLLPTRAKSRNRTVDFASRAEPSRAEPSRAEPSRAEPSRAEPSRAMPSHAASECAGGEAVNSWAPRSAGKARQRGAVYSQDGRCNAVQRDERGGTTCLRHIRPRTTATSAPGSPTMRDRLSTSGRLFFSVAWFAPAPFSRRRLLATTTASARACRARRFRSGAGPPRIRSSTAARPTHPARAQYPTRHGIPRRMVSHVAWYPTRHGIPRDTVAGPPRIRSRAAARLSLL